MDLKSRYINLIILTSVFFIGLGIGLLVKRDESAPIIIDKNAKIGLPAQSSDIPIQVLQQTSGNFVASINGKSYYPKDCPSAKRIKEENMVWFNTALEAEAQGYKPAQNCS